MWRGTLLAAACLIVSGCGSANSGSAGAAGNPPDSGAKDSGAKDSGAEDGSAANAAPCQVLEASDSGAFRRFGSDGALSGNQAIVTAPGNVDPFVAPTVYVFEQSSGTWAEVGEMTFKNDVLSAALDGDEALVGLDDADSTGSVAVLLRGASGFTEQQTLKSATVAGWFGRAIAAQAGTLVVGAPGNMVTSYAGAVHVFSRSGTTWTETQELTPSDGVGGEGFGSAVALDADTIAVGTRPDTGAAGTWAVYVFGASGTKWVEQAKLVDPAGTGSASSRFGTGLALDGDTLLVSGSSSGKDIVFVRGAQGWSQQATLSPATESLLVALDGDTAVLSAIDHTYVATRKNGAWTAPRQICPIGGVLSFQNGNALIGEASDRDGYASGAAYVIRVDSAKPGEDGCACRIVKEPVCSSPPPPPPPPDKDGGCPAGYSPLTDSQCDIGGVNCSTIGMCVRSCKSNRDCPDPCRPHCTYEMLWNGGDACGSIGPLICSETWKAGCPQ